MLYMALSSRAGSKAVCWPSQPTLAVETGLSESTLRRALRLLEDVGLIETTVETTPTGRHNTYRINAHRKEGSGQSDRMGAVSVTGKEEPVEEEQSPPTTLPSRPQVVDERRGRMTDSWNPAPGVLTTAKNAYPRVAVDREVVTFRAWHQSKAPVERTQTEWDNLFVTWCGRKQEQWDQANPPADQGVRYDEVTGLPVNPKQGPNPRPEERE
jgi:hypothetical protein